VCCHCAVASCVIARFCWRFNAQTQVDGYILVYSVTSMESFKTVELALEQLVSMVQLKLTPIVVGAAQGAGASFSVSASDALLLQLI
jgi:hypothetical protein